MSKKSSHYVDNEKFYQEMIEWKKVVKEAEDMGEPKPPVTEYIGTCFLEIAERLSHRPNFFNYPYREEMVGDAIVKMLTALENKKFDVNKGSSPFSYFTRIVFHAFIKCQYHMQYNILAA